MAGGNPTSMVPTQEDRAASSDVPENAIPRQREYTDQAQVLADDRLIEAIRTDQITEKDLASPVVRMLVRWRKQALVGL